MDTPASSSRPAGLRAVVPYLRVHRGTLVLAASLSLLEAGGMLAQPLLTRAAMNRLADARPVGVVVALLVAVVLAVTLAGGVRDYLLQRTAEGLIRTARRRLVGHLLRLPVAEFDRRRSGDLLSRVGADTTLLRAVVTSGLLESASGLITVVGAAVCMAVIDPLLFSATLGGITGGLLTILVLARRMRGAAHLMQARMGEMTASLERALSAVRTVRANSAEERESAAVDADAVAAYRAGLDVSRINALVTPITSTTMQVALLIVLGVGGARVSAGAISVGDLVAYVLLLFLLWFPLARTVNAYARLQSGLGALHRIEEVFDIPTETAADRRPAFRADRASSAPDGEQPPAIEFDSVGFAYDGGETVLEGVSFTVARGSRTALVGPSGAGKSTILALVERFYDVTAGAIRIDGVDVRALPRIELRRRLGFVEQEAPVLAGTLRGNLTLAAPAVTEDEMLTALRSVNLTDLAHRAALGLDAQVGEGGVLLSGGERQRLALARTLLAEAPILLLDEPTSNLDARNEAALRDMIGAAFADRTLLVVAHRLSTVVDSDQIVVLERGRVVAVGRHEELLAGNALYRELAAHQFLLE